MTAIYSYTSDFREEFEAETGSLMRRRFTLYAWGSLLLFVAVHFARPLLALGIILASAPSAQTWSSRLESLSQRYFSGEQGLWSILILTVISAAVSTAGTAHVRRRVMSNRQLVLVTQWMFFIYGAIQVAAYVLTADVGFPWAVMLSHMLASALVPWTAKQSLRPIIPVLLVNAASVLLFSRWTPSEAGAVCVLSAFSIAPGVLICRLRHSRRMDRFQLNFLQTRYGQLRKELVDARRIHEALFPKPISRGMIRFDYRYLPMRLIGGDYFYVRQSPVRPASPPVISAILLDVTGHGIAAALTVNRLYGEIERYFAEHPDARPGDVLRNLNRYVHLTLANHSIYATALCVRIDPLTNELEFASGGHPPAFLRGVDGTVDQLASTAFVLGAAEPDDFDPAPESRRFMPGDTLIAYTDGAIEARNARGRMLGVAGLQRLVAGAAPINTGGWAPAILAAVDSHRDGAPMDDTLIVEIYRTFGTDSESTSGKTSVGKLRTREYIVVRN